MKTLRLLAVLLLSLPALALAAATDISREEYQARRADGAAMLVLDVRSAEEFAAGHVPGAINIPHDQLGARHGELKGATGELVVYCRSGRRSALAVETLEGAGYTGLRHLQGDMQGWEAAGLPVEK